MENTTEKKKPVKNKITPYYINQAFVGLGLGEADVVTLRYLDYLNTQIPINAAYFYHVLPKDNLLNALYEKETQALIGDYKLENDMRNRMEEDVKNTIKTRENISIEYGTAEGNPLEEMIAFTEVLQPDLLVIGQNYKKSEHGILAKNMVRMSTVNALVIPLDAKSKISTILVPIDFSDSSVKALKAAIAINKCLKEPVKIIGLHVYSMPDTPYFRNQEPWVELKGRVERNHIDGFASFLETNVGDYKNQVEFALVERQSTGTASFIMDFANNNNVDFLVMGARGHSKVHLMLMGSVTEGVMDRNNSIPTLVVRT